MHVELVGAANTFIASDDLFYLFLWFVERRERHKILIVLFDQVGATYLCAECNFTCCTNHTLNNQYSIILNDNKSKSHNKNSSKSNTFDLRAHDEYVHTKLNYL